MRIDQAKKKLSELTEKINRHKEILESVPDGAWDESNGGLKMKKDRIQVEAGMENLRQQVSDLHGVTLDQAILAFNTMSRALMNATATFECATLAIERIKRVIETQKKGSKV